MSLFEIDKEKVELFCVKVSTDHGKDYHKFFIEEYEAISLKHRICTSPYRLQVSIIIYPTTFEKSKKVMTIKDYEDLFDIKIKGLF